jgi:hypothetical protein
MTNMGVFATADEIEQVREALDTPMIMVGGALPLSPAALCHALALKHGLPEIEGYYGMTQAGEFVKI